MNVSCVTSGLEQGFYTLGNAESSLIPTSQVIPGSCLKALQVVNLMLHSNMQVTSQVKINPQNNNKLLNQEFWGDLSYTHAQTHIFMIKSFTQHHNTTWSLLLSICYLSSSEIGSSKGSPTFCMCTRGTVVDLDMEVLLQKFCIIWAACLSSWTFLCQVRNTWISQVNIIHQAK